MCPRPSQTRSEERNHVYPEQRYELFRAEAEIPIPREDCKPARPDDCGDGKQSKWNDDATRVATTGRTATRTSIPSTAKDDYSKHAKNDDDHKDRDHWKNGDKDDYSKHGKDEHRSTPGTTTITRIATTGRTATRTIIRSTARTTTRSTPRTMTAPMTAARTAIGSMAGRTSTRETARATTRSTMVVGRTPRTTIAAAQPREGLLRPQAVRRLRQGRHPS